jgi:hypothetical protein
MAKMTRLALISRHGYFNMKKGKLWFSKWLSHEVLPKGALKAHPGETDFERYKRLALKRGDRILYLVHARPKS